MPLAVDPEQTISIVLQSDEGKKNAPIFVYRYLTMRQQRRSDQCLRHQIDENPKSDDTYYADVLEAVRMGLVKVQNWPQFQAESIDDLLTLDEIMELITRRDVLQMPSFEDKKKLSSPPDSDAEPSAENAEALPGADPLSK